MIEYHHLNLPDELVARFRAWQHRFDSEYCPDHPDPAYRDPPPEWCEEMQAEEIALARALYEAVGGKVRYYAKGFLWTVGKDEPEASIDELEAFFQRENAE